MKTSASIQMRVSFGATLAETPEVLQTIGDTALKRLATELTEKLRSSTTAHWQVRDAVRGTMRILIRQLLHKSK